MKILIYSYYYAPEPIGVGKFSGETAVWLAAAGHEVRVVAPPPHYPQQKIVEGYSAFYARQKLDGVTVMRCPLLISRRQSGLGRILQYISFSLSSAPVLSWWGLTWRPDVVMTVLPPTSGIPGALVGAWLGGSLTWLHVQDFDIDIAFEMNFLKSRRARSALLWLERRLMSANKIVSSITPRMVDRLRQKGVTAEIVEFPNWADTGGIHPLDGPSALRAELGIAEGDFVALYSGNLGQKQGIDGLVEVARRLVQHERIRIVIGGDGAGRARLAELAQGLPNVQLIPLQPLSRLNDLLNLANVHLLPQKANVADLVMPSKLGGMLASGRPVVAGAAAGTQLAREVASCGIVVPPEDNDAIAEAVLALYRDPAECARLGVAARQQALARWDRAGILSAFTEKLVSARRNS